jgi:antitoxin (DNA-binding transcriptional repressor) of toxin-antitoxin stability system
MPLRRDWLLQRLVRPRLTVLDILCDRSYIIVMKTIAAAKFKEQCLSMLDHLDPDGVVITKHGKPVARVLPAERASADLIGALRGRVSVKGDVQSTGLTWEAHG